MIRYLMIESKDLQHTWLSIKHGNCHVLSVYKDDTVLGNWVASVQQREFKLSEMQEQVVALGFAWNINTINLSKRQQMILEVCSIVYLHFVIPQQY